MTDLPAAAIEAALHSLHDTGCKCGGGYHPPPESDLKRLHIALEAAAPHITAAATTAERFALYQEGAAAQRARLRQVADPVMLRRVANQLGLSGDAPLPVRESLFALADLLADTP